MRYSLRQLNSWSLLSVVIGLSLLVAAAFKGHEVATEELLEESLLTSRWFLILAVEWEIFFALWLLGGFHRSYPSMTRWVALIYFFALFVVALESVLKGRPSCPCFGKSIFSPWIVASFDVLILLLLAISPLTSPSAGIRPRSHWFGLVSIFGAFGLLYLITMADYSTSHSIPNLRRDSRLFVGAMTMQYARPTTEDLLAHVRSTTNLSLTIDERLSKHPPDYGTWDLKAIKPWTVMELLAHRQSIPARWNKIGDGYELVPAASFGKDSFFWISGAALMVIVMLGLRWRDEVKRRETASVRDARIEKASEMGVHATS